MNSATWTCSNYNSSSPAWVTATVLNEKLRHAQRSTAKCGATAASPTTSGQLTTYEDCSGTLKTILVSQSAGQGGDHCLLELNGNCTTTLAGDTGLDYKTELFNFFKQF